MERKKPFSLPENFKKRWVEALRSGNYKQGLHRLVSTSEKESVYCCLGVAGRLLGINDEDLESSTGSDNAGLPCDLYTSLKEKYPVELQQGSDDTFVSLLAKLNDGITLSRLELYIKENPELIFRKMPAKVGIISYTFSEIADWIEDNVEGYDDTQAQFEELQTSINILNKTLNKKDEEIEQWKELVAAKEREIGKFKKVVENQNLLVELIQRILHKSTHDSRYGNRKVLNEIKSDILGSMHNIKPL